MKLIHDKKETHINIFWKKVNQMALSSIESLLIINHNWGIAETALSIVNNATTQQTLQGKTLSKEANS